MTDIDVSANTIAKRKQRASEEYRKLEAQRRRTKYKKREWEATLRSRSTKSGWLKYAIIRARHRAKKSGIEFSITEADVTVPDFCPVFGIAFCFKPSGKSNSVREKHNAPSLDRIDNSKGYIPGNVAVISLRANVLKSDATLDDLKKICQYMAGVMYYYDSIS